MECDEEELKATKEKSADEMFEELGYIYKKHKIKSKYILYVNDTYYKKTTDVKSEHIEFDEFNKKILFIGENKGVRTNGNPIYKDMYVPYCSAKTIKAINKKCEELKWI